MSRRRLIACALVFAIALSPFCAAGFGEARAAETAPASQVSNQDGVKITVAPRGFPRGAKTWDFTITLETHTQPLDDDLARASTLIADGKPYRPLGWEGAPAGGHHRKGVLHFDAVTPLPQAVELQIRRTGEAIPRIFRWQLGSRP
ncbi:MAG: hypothetical protein HY018_12365 [Hydrogenophilales bacterium]|nr:hypothetical protein [Hydrogenophilales bacterium]